MAEQLKNMFFTQESINVFADKIREYYPEFDKAKFVKLIFSSEWDSKELKEKMRHTTLCLHKTLPQNYTEALDILRNIAPYIKGFEAMTLPDYVEVYGLDDWDKSLSALRHFTQYSSSEFAIRPFIAQDPGRVMAVLSDWADDTSYKVRRCASEGCRPRLPWAMALPVFKKDPSPILPILEKLRDDESESVRRSVANNLNDISKDNPDVVLDVCLEWYGQSENTDRLIKHACRGLLKSGDKRALLLLGYSDPAHMSVENLKLGTDTVIIGENLPYSFELKIDGKKESRVRLEYRMDFAKSGGKKSSKIFRIIENTYAPGIYSIKRKHSFVDMSTRKHYEGTHRITIIVNGEEKAVKEFEVKK